MSRAKKITVCMVSCLFLVALVLMLFWFFGESYPQFYKIANKEFSIAGLDEGFTPQGLTYEPTTKTFYVCGYMKDGSPSRIYVVNGKTYKTVKQFSLIENEVAYTGHAGGITTDGTNVWVCGDGKVLRFDFSKIKTTYDGDALEITDSFETENGADFITINNNELWVGEFQRNKTHETDQNHHVETESGTNKALALCYEIDSKGLCGLKSTTPIKALSIGSLGQGMIINGDKIVLSTSYSLANSHIKVYNNVLNTQTEVSTKIILGQNVIPLYILNDNVLIKDIEAPCMSEELAFANNKVFCLFESACKKYGFATRTAFKNVYSLDI